MSKRKKRTARNRKANFQAAIAGLLFIVAGSMGYIVLDIFMNGAGNNQDSGMLDIAQNELNISTNNTTFQIVQNSWKVAPFALILGGFIVIIRGSLKKEFDESVFARGV